MSKKNNPRLPLNDSFTDFLLYTTPNGKVKVEIFLLKNIFESGELQEEQVSSILEHTTQHGAIGNFSVNHTHPIANLVRSQLNRTQYKILSSFEDASVIRKSRITDTKVQLFGSDFDRIIKFSLGGLNNE